MCCLSLNTEPVTFIHFTDILGVQICLMNYVVNSGKHLENVHK